MKHVKYNRQYVLFVYFILGFLSISLFKNQAKGYYILFFESILDLLLFSASIFSFFTKNVKERYLYLLIAISFFFAIISDFFYNYYVNIFLIDPNIFQDSLYDIPFIGFLFFLLLFWCFLFKETVLINFKKLVNIEKINLFISLFISIFSSYIFIISINWKIEIFSIIGIYQISDSILESLLLSVLINIIILSKKKRYFF